MGLTGIIRASLQLTPVETASLLVNTIRTPDLDQTMACLAEANERYGYTVAWLDCLAAGRARQVRGDQR
jgi:decaprenylphospho-beta-D-ribofuranose 2-oxidase